MRSAPQSIAHTRTHARENIFYTVALALKTKIIIFRIVWYGR